MGGTGIPRMVDGGAKMEEDDEPWAKIMSVVYWGNKQDHELPDVAGCLPQYEYDARYNGVERKMDVCAHLASPVRRVCSDGVDTGRRFLSCHLRWIDKPWEGRERSVIADLATKKELLEKKVREKDDEIEDQKVKHRMEKKMLLRMHKDQLNSRDRMIMFAVFMYLGLVAIMFAMVGRK